MKLRMHSCLNPFFFCYRCTTGVEKWNTKMKLWWMLPCQNEQVQPNWIGNVWCKNFNLHGFVFESIFFFSSCVLLFFRLFIAVCIPLFRFGYGVWIVLSIEILSIESKREKKGNDNGSHSAREQSLNVLYLNAFSILLNSRVSIHNAAFHCSKSE